MKAKAFYETMMNTYVFRNVQRLDENGKIEHTYSPLEDADVFLLVTEMINSGLNWRSSEEVPSGLVKYAHDWYQEYSTRFAGLFWKLNNYKLDCETEGMIVFSNNDGILLVDKLDKLPCVGDGIDQGSTIKSIMYLDFMKVPNWGIFAVEKVWAFMDADAPANAALSRFAFVAVKQEA